MHILSHWIVASIAIGVAAYVVPEASVTLRGAVVAAVVLGGLNLIIRPILFVLTLPVNVLTLGLFTLVINACMVWLASLLVPGFMVAGFWTALLFALVLVLINWVFNAWAK